MRAIIEFWRGNLPLGRALWLWRKLGGGIVSLFSTLFTLMLLAAEAPAWLAIVVFAALLPTNLVLLVAVWRSNERGGVSREIDYGTRVLILAWVIAISGLALPAPGRRQTDASWLRPGCASGRWPTIR